MSWRMISLTLASSTSASCLTVICDGSSMGPVSLGSGAVLLAGPLPGTRTAVGAPPRPCGRPFDLPPPGLPPPERAPPPGRPGPPPGLPGPPGRAPGPPGAGRAPVAGRVPGPPVIGRTVVPAGAGLMAGAGRGAPAGLTGGWPVRVADAGRGESVGDGRGGRLDESDMVTSMHRVSVDNMNGLTLSHVWRVPARRGRKDAGGGQSMCAGHRPRVCRP
jgi:hypothetical protein